MYQDEYEAISEAIRKSAYKALELLDKPWNVKVSHPDAENHVDFFNEHRRYLCNVHFDLPPNPDEEWYTREIIRQLQEKCLGKNNN